jgi:hypothetical protein
LARGATSKTDERTAHPQPRGAAEKKKMFELDFSSNAESLVAILLVVALIVVVLV